MPGDVIVWTWLTVTFVGSLALGWMTREAYRDLVHARDEEKLRYILNARIIFRATSSWLVAFILMFAIGAVSLLRPDRAREPLEWLIALTFLAAALQVVRATVLNWRDSRHLHRLIEADIRKRLKGDSS